MPVENNPSFRIEGKNRGRSTAKTALVTGGSKEIGRKIAGYLAAAGHSIMINYRSGAQQAESFAELKINHYFFSCTA
ncbi:hypothetical protein NLX67_12015 [Domibacillus sp. A3M-37]|uniref:hypothetical protein n=1 Tax=Domibacillus sp. A3M-37 TaxID=2962037 RepID=UPI0020B651C3|nr:hypothetical protein [Domibacillus sp. A3M-37]MCP3763108.1 hypothetical protein [Domibacillus sp. A3M-37]